MYITQAIKRSAQLYGDSLATICRGRERTWSEVEARVAKFAGALRQLGVEKGERVAILSLNSDRYYEYFFAVPWAGGVFEIQSRQVQRVPGDAFSSSRAGRE